MQNFNKKAQVIKNEADLIIEIPLYIAKELKLMKDDIFHLEVEDNKLKLFKIQQNKTLTLKDKMAEINHRTKRLTLQERIAMTKYDTLPTLEELEEHNKNKK